MAEAGASGGPVDPHILAEAARREPPRPLPWRRLAALFVPAAALAAGVGLQLVFEGPRPEGDSLLRWLCWSSGAGLAMGAAAGALACRRAAPRAAWAFFGAASPWALAGLVLLAGEVSQPLRAALAERRVARCRETRPVCTSAEFRTGCAAAAAKMPGALQRGMAAFGAPAQRLCGATGCTYRWVYAGPWTPDELGQAGAIWCSLVTDAAGAGMRSALVAETRPP
jgi:hypothetical protein